MKQYLYKFVSCLLLIVAAVNSGHAAISYDTPVEQKICPGDTVKLDTRQTVVYSDTTLYDTVLVASPTPPVLDTVVKTYRVNVYPTYIYVEPERLVERGGDPFVWHGLNITKAGFYEKVFKSQHGCDSIHRVRVRERVEVQVRDTLCIGDTKTWNGQVISAGGIYRDSIHFLDYDSITILNMIGHVPDTTKKNVRIAEGTTYTWNEETYSTSGVYEKLYTGRFGCDSLSLLNLTVYHVDTIDTAVIVCPGETYTWNGITQGQAGSYSIAGTRDNNDRVIYRMNLTVKTLQEETKSFRICDGESVIFNGETYSEAGTFYNHVACDTVYKILIQKNPSTLHLQTGVLDATHPFYWQYSLNGVLKVDTIYDAGIYEYTTKNEETGCNDTWRLVLTKDETDYHIIEEVTVCENETFNWHGLSNLNKQGIGQTLHYFDRYRTAADQDSIYELILTVKPVLRSTRTIPFCGSVTWNNVTYTESTIVVDTLKSIQYNCDSIVTTILAKGIAFHHHDTISIYPGETTIWRGQTIDHDGQFEERHITSYGCDSIYTVGVGLREAAPVTNTRSYNVAICEGDYYQWEVTGEKYFNSGDYTEPGTVDPDSIYILHLTVNPKYASTERVTFTHFPASYRDQIIYETTDYVDVHYSSSLGCDSIIRVYVDREVIRDEISATICPGETFLWRGHEYKEAYRYVETEQGVDGKDSVEHVLNLSVRYIPETRINKNICEGGSYTFADQVLTQTGIYRYTFREDGCDSVVVLSLNVLKADTNTFVHHMDQGDSYVWNGDTYWKEGVYYDRQINRFGCDSINVLELTVNHVDTVDTTVVICPNEIPFRWHGIRASQTGDYSAGERQDDGSYNFYRLHLTVRELVRIDTTFTICDDQNVSFNGKTYSESGRFFDYLSCDTLMEVIINKHPQQVYVTTASLSDDHGYTWHFKRDGQEIDSTFYIPTTYEFESPNPETGCSELWRLVLTKDETEYNFVEERTICENEEFSWRGHGGLNHQGIGSTSVYYDKYVTRTGKDSIYKLILTVNPLKRTTQTINFCESYTFNGKTYTTSATVIDTLKTAYGCDSIVTTVLVKGNTFHRHDTATIVPGETLYWRGQIITNSGLYKDQHYSVSGCDSIYTLGVGMEEAAPQMKIRTWNETICEGDAFPWRNKNYFNTGTYVDTVFVGNTRVVDSLYILNLTVNPVYRWSERITFTSFPANYRNHTFNAPATIEIRYASTEGCDSILTLSVDWEVIRDEVTEVICPGETFMWRGNLYSAASRYTEIETGSKGQDSIEHVLNLIVRYIPDTYITKTICNGSSYTFGDRVLTESGNYTYTFHTTCDSTVHLSLNVLSVDTNRLVHHMNDGEKYEWNDKIYDKTGTYFYYGTNRFGCDSVAVLQLTVNKVDTIDSIATICPSTTLYWHGISASQTGDYYSSEKQSDGSYNYYRLHLNVLELQQIDTTFTICDDESVTFNGVTYSEAGHFDNYLTCDTLIRVHINKHPQRVYETRASLGGDHGYTWHFKRDGQDIDSTFYIPTTYEFESPNEETGCSEIWRLYLTKDEDDYHFEEWKTVCQGDPFVWHGHSGWSNQNVGKTTDYEQKYKTRNGKDSIYTLHLTVNPVARTYRTITFCGETTYKGKTYSESAQIVDTLTSANGCDSIITINLDKVNSYIFDEHHDLPQGEIYNWHGLQIGTDGVYHDNYTTIYGCDSIYRLTVTIIEATPETNQYTENWSLCEGDTVVWRGKDIWRGGTYVENVWKDGHTEIDSIFVLNLTMYPSYRDTIIRHMYTCSEGAAIYYQGKVYHENTTVISNLKTIHGCDSIVKVYMHFNTATFLERSDTIVDTELPYTWTYQLPDPLRADTVLTTSGTYHHFITSEGGCTNEERMTLVVRPTYLYEKDTTVCETELPFLWRGQSLQHTIGETKQYEDPLKSIYGTDSIYRLNLTIVPAPRRTERISICENRDTIINGKSYFDKTIYKPGVVYHDTAYKHNEGNACDSIIYYEITITPQRHIIETRIKHVGETFEWHGQPITAHETKTYTLEDEIDSETGCEIIYQLRVIAESAEFDQICELDLPYTWDKNNQNYLTSGVYTDTVRDAQGYITDFYSLTLQVDTVQKATQYYYVCVGHPTTIFGRTYGDDINRTDYVDEFTVPFSVSGNSCQGELKVVVTVSTEKIQENTVILRQGESLDWSNYHITEGGEYRDTTTIDAQCDSISILYVIAENRKDVTVCSNDTAKDVHPDKKYPYVWITPRGKQDTLYVSGIYTDTVFNAKGFIEEYNTLHLTVTQAYDTTITVRGCKNNGAYWRDEIYFRDTTFVDRVPVRPFTPDAPCDSVFHVTIKIDTVYYIERYDTICEHKLPYVVGQPGNRLDSVYREGWQAPFEYKTACGCDSIVNVHLTIIPDFDIDGTDSIFVCEEAMPLYLGDTVNPAFDPYREKVDEWQGKWIGVKISNDTVIYNCGKVDSLHIIMRPHQAHIPVYEYSLCQGDSVQLFWPHKDTWIKEPGDYTDTVITISAWEDTKHHTIIHNDRAYECDSIVTWKVRHADTLHVHDYKHIREGETYRFNDSILSTTGVYDSIGYYIDIMDPLDPAAPAVTMMDSAHHYCKAVYTLHLTVDPVYRYGDTIEICHPANREYTYTFDDDLTDHYQFKFQTPDQDTAIIHKTDSTKHLSYQFYDHFYDLVVYYKQQYEVTIKDTICYGDSIQFDQHYFENENNITVERYLKDAGNYSDTLVALNGCDSIIHLYLYVRDRIVVAPQSATVTDRELPYEWTHVWREPGASKDTTHIDSLYVSGDYSYTMHNKFGCDSTVTINLTVHPTHVFRDTIDVCAPKETTHTHLWNTGYAQKFTVPAADDTISYADTLTTLFPLDSIYVLFVHYSEQTITYLDSTICFGDSIRFGLTKSHTQRFLSKTNIYRDTLVRTFNGCDSIIELRLNVLPRYFNDSTRHISIADTPYIWNHVQNGTIIKSDTLHAPGDYKFTYYSKFGCDSIDSLHLYFHQNYLYRDTVQICQSETPYTWGSKTDIYHTGEYVQNFRIHDGQADSTCVRFVRVMPVMYDTITTTICEGDSIRFGLTKSGRPRFLSLTGLYNDTLATVHGCDSIITLSLNVYPKYLKHKQVDIADVDTPYIWPHESKTGQIFKSDTLYASGEYRFVYQSAFGCDSIDSLSLRVHATYEYHDTVSICYDQTPYAWYNEDSTKIYKKDIYETGSYTAYLQTHDGYDSTLIRYVQVLPVLHDTVRHSMCEGSDYWFNGVRYTEGGTYVDTLRSTAGCDSIVSLFLTVNKPIYVRVPVDIYEGESYEFFGETYTTSGTYRHAGFTPEGCDSVAELFLNVHKQIDTTVIVCNGDLPYLWTNKWTGEVKPLYNAGIYRNDTSYVNGKRTFYTIQLIVNEAKYDTIRAAICATDSYKFNGIALTESGIYENTVKGSNGCDSTTTLFLTVNQPYHNYIERHILEGQSVTVLGLTFDKDTLHTIKSNTPSGCDSITDIKVIVHPMVDTTVVVCSNDLPYQWTNKWNGQVTPLYTAGIYRNDTTYDEDGRQLFYGLQLIVNNPVVTVIRDSICEDNDSYYYFKKQNLTEAGIYRDTLQKRDGCDSIVELHLTVNKPYYNYIERHILEGQSVTVLGLTFDKDTLHTIKSNTPSGCDSITDIKVIVHPMVDTTVVVCSNDLPYQWTNKWNGQVTPLYAAGIYRNDTTYLNGERMFYGLQLVVNNPVVTVIRDSICENNDSYYYFKKQNLTEAGIYRDTLQKKDGCDSIVELHLTVNKPYYNYIERHIIEGQSVSVLGLTFTKDTLHTIKGYTPSGCDSITDIKVIVHPMVDTTVIVCSNDLPYQWINKWNGQITPLYTAGLYRNDTTYVNGERMFYGLQLVVNNPVVTVIRDSICEDNDSYYYFKKQNLTEAGIYRDTLQKKDGCDSIVELHLTVNKPYYNYIERHIIEGQSVSVLGVTFDKDTLHTIKGYTPSGCDSITDIKVIVHPMVDTTVIVCSNDLPYQWINKWNGQITPLYTAGIYRNDTTYLNGERMFYGLKLIVNNPVVVTNHAAICEGSSYLFNGRHLADAGIYYDTLQKKDGCDSIVELHLTINKPYFNTRTEHILEGDTIFFYGDTLYTTGTYTHHARTPEQCDSTTVLQLIVHPMIDTIVTVCKSDLPYQWVNTWTGSVTPLYNAGLYRNDTTYLDGERMYYGLLLRVTEPTDTTIYRKICEGDSYNFNGKQLYYNGEYRDTIKNVNGCDSVVILHLNVLKKYYNTIERTIYEGDTVHFQDQVLSTSGIYPARFTSSYGCDSIIELRLTVIRLFDDSISVCANDLPYQWTLPSDPTKTMTIYESGIYRDTVVNTEGQKTAIGLKVTVLPIKFAPEPIVATICEGDFYKFGEEKLTVQGTYYDTLTAVNGCDSIVSLSLQVMPVQHQIDTRTIYEGDTVFFYGDTCTVSGIYTHTERTTYGVNNSTLCYDSYQLILTVLKEFHVDTTAYVCANDLPFVWHGYEYSETGSYTLPTAWTDSSRVVTTLHLTVRNTAYAEENVTLCHGNTFIINGDTIRESGSYYDTIPARNGCDSITRYIISVQPVFERWDTVYISDQDTYTFCPDSNGIARILDKTGDYECVGKTAHGCDDIHHLHLEVHPSYHFTEYLDLCAPDTIEWHGQKIYAEGKQQVNAYLTRYGNNVEKHYFDRYLTTYGFDSIYELVVTNHPSFYTYEQHLIKELNEEGTYIHGIHITKLDTIYRDTLKTAYGCDSIFQIAVNTKRTITVERTKRICDDGNGYNFYGQLISKAGKYSTIVPGGVGSTFDTIVNLTLIVNPVSMTKTRIVITEEDIPYIYGGKYYTDQDIKMPQWDQNTQKWVPDVATTVIEDKYLNQYGCDSTNLIEFVVTTHYSEWNQVPLCTGSRLIIDNDTITKAGQYTFVRRSTVTNRLDSLYRIEVYEAPNYEMPVVKRSICRGDTVQFAGKTFDRNGLHPVKLKSVDGCDSIVWLELTVYPAFRMDTTVRLMQEELPFEWEHRKYYNGGDYERSWQIGECDSTRVLHLIVIAPDTTRAAVCVNDMPFVWAYNNQLYTESGIYLDTLRDNKGKVYSIGMLELSVVNPTTSTISVSPINSELIKENDKSFDINFTANQGANLRYDIWFDNAALKAGFEDQNDLAVTKNGVASVPMPTTSDVSKCNAEDQCGVRPGYYKVWIKIHNACNESTFGPLDFYIKYPHWIIQQKWDDIVAPISTECNCGYEFETIEWSYNGGAWQTGPYLHLPNGTIFHDGETVTMRAKRRGVNEQAVLSHPLPVYTYGGDEYQYPCYDCTDAKAQVRPRIAPRNAPVVTIEAKVEGTYDIYSSTGMFIEHGTFINGNTTVTLPTISGLYFIRTTIDEQTTTHKVLLY